MTQQEFPNPGSLATVGKNKYYEKMKKLLSKKAGKKMTIHIIDKSSILKDITNKPFPFFGAVDAKKSKEWADFLQKEANMGKCICEKNADGSLTLQIKIKNCKKEQELVDMMNAQGFFVKFVDKLMKDGKEIGDEDPDDDSDDVENPLEGLSMGGQDLPPGWTLPMAKELHKQARLFTDPATDKETKAKIREGLRRDIPEFLQRCEMVKGQLNPEIDKIYTDLKALWAKWQQQEAAAAASSAVETPEQQRAKTIATEIKQLLDELNMN